MEELCNAISKLKNKKAAGLDKLTSEFLKAMPEDICKLLLRLINKMYLIHIVPKEKCIDYITP